MIVDRPTPLQVHLAVVDKSPHVLPLLKAPGAQDERGRGHLLVDRLADSLADRWGCDILGSARRPWDKGCWAELRITAGVENRDRDLA
ncbi:hypothetical protein [Streptomyces sp. DB-54]